MDFSRDEWRVLVPLALVGFFEVYDVALLTLAAPLIADGLGVSIAAFGIGVALIRLATLGSVPVLRLADRRGRRAALVLSLGAFTIATGATALAWGIVAFVAMQMIARVFLATETALANLVVAEEVRADRRGAGLSALGVLSGLGYGAVAGMLLLVPLTPLDWRLFYLAALVPLGGVAYLRRRLRETQAFTAAAREHRLQRTLWPRVAPALRRPLWRVAALVSAFGLVQTSGFFYASDLAQSEYRWSGLFTTLILVSAAFGVLGFWLGGRISDVVGRRPMIAAAILLGAAGTAMVFTQVRGLFPPGFFLLATAGSCFLTASLAYVAELFPTELRATLTSFVLACQVAAGSAGLAVVGGLAGVVSPYVVMLVAGGALSASVVALRGLPETACQDMTRPLVTLPSAAGG